jgi:hypothetical protein
MQKKLNMAKFKFIATISKLDKEKRMIWIPKKYLPEVEKFEGKQVRVQIDDEF